MDIHLKRVTDKWGDADWIIYESGRYKQPLLIVTEYELARLFEQFNEERKTPAKGRKRSTNSVEVGS